MAEIPPVCIYVCKKVLCGLSTKSVLPPTRFEPTKSAFGKAIMKAFGPIPLNQ